MNRFSPQACLAAWFIFAQAYVGGGSRIDYGQHVLTTDYDEDFLLTTNSSEPVTFHCPDECWECCGVKGWVWRQKGEFKCILRDKSMLPPGRNCSEAEERSHEEESAKTHCQVFPNEVGEPEEYCTTHSAFSKFVTWAWDKKSEVFGLANSNVMEMGSIISLIHKRVGQKRARRVKKILPLSELVPIHPVDVMNAIRKTGARARAAVAAREILEEHNSTLTQELVKNEPKLKIFQSINVFYVLNLGPQEGYVTFEGNGRSVALRWAFPESDPFRKKLQVEVEDFIFEKESDRLEVLERIKKLRKAMGSKEFDGMHPPALDEEAINAWGAKVPAMIKEKIALRDKNATSDDSN